MQDLPTTELQLPVSPAEQRIRLLEPPPPLLIGYAAAGPVGEPRRVSSLAEFARTFAPRELDGAALPHAVRGFFANGGGTCWVQRLAGTPGSGSLDEDTLTQIAALETSAIAVPDLYALKGGVDAAFEAQQQLVADADRHLDRFVLVDPPDRLDAEEVEHWRRRTGLRSRAAVVYFPWIESAPARGPALRMPAGGHLLGVWERAWHAHGIHRAPTGEPLLAVEGVGAALSGDRQRSLNRAGVNCLRAFPGPDLRVWGARTLSSDGDWCYIHRRRVYALIVASLVEGARWVGESELDEALLGELRDAVVAFLTMVWRRGALQGTAPAQAFAVRCTEAEDTPGHVVLEVGLALRQPSTHRSVRIVLRAASAPDD
jgi:hypothetical protein